MRIDFLGLHAFVAIAERGSFQHAAAHLNLSQTALSHRIRKLEEDLGVKLLSRTTREVSLTQAGLGLLPKVKETIEGLAGSLDELRRAGRSRQETLAIGCLPTVASGRLPQALQCFQERHPDVFVRIYDNSASEIAELVQSGAVEFGITMVAAHRWDFDIELLIKDSFVLVCPKDHPLASHTSLSWSDIAEEPLIRISARAGNRIIIDDALGSRRESQCWRFEVQHIQTAVALVRTGVALTVVPRLSMDTVDERGLRLVPLKNPSVTRQLGIVSKRGVPLSPLADEFRRIVVRTFA
ncbi:LysR family transcriptional regulator [Microvirga sp. TS319]|uniref:LysR family transcriptional regulator n=1 Tax=Microvirga sp. TS319 TaxID=3241165 RepID=UPI00351A6516